MKSETYQIEFREPKHSDGDIKSGDESDPSPGIEWVLDETEDEKPKSKGKKKKVLDRAQLTFPTSLPEWGTQVQDVIDDNQLLIKTRLFVNAASHYIRNLTNDAPLPSEYTAFARTLCQKYPVLEELSISHDQPHVSTLFILHNFLYKYCLSALCSSHIYHTLNFFITFFILY
jgi:hypothetical protein